MAVRGDIRRSWTKVVAVGAGRRAARSSVQGERDYRGSQATWVVLDGQELELLITDEKRLLRLGARADATDFELRERWQRRTAAAPKETLLPVEEYEAKLRSKRRFAWITVGGVIALGTTLFLGVPAIQRAIRHPPTMLSEAEVDALRDITQEHRVAAYRSDDDWRKSMLAREHVLGTDAACVRLDGTLEGLIPVAVIARDGELPQVSARTSAIIRELEKLDARFESTEQDRHEEELAIANVVRVSPLDLLLEIDVHDHAILWLYDHDTRRIVCRGEPNEHAMRGLEVAPGALASLHDVR